MNNNTSLTLESIDGFGPKGGENLSDAEHRLLYLCQTKPELHRRLDSYEITYLWEKETEEVAPFVTCPFENFKVTKLELRDVIAVQKANLLARYLNWVLREGEDQRTWLFSGEIANLAAAILAGEKATPFCRGWRSFAEEKDHDGKHVCFELSARDGIAYLTATFHET